MLLTWRINKWVKVMVIRRATNNDKEDFIEFSVELSKFNRSIHSLNNKYDDYAKVIKAIREKSAATFDNRNDDTLILIVTSEEKSVGYVLGRVYEEARYADNGTGLIGLIDELYIDYDFRGNGLGQILLDETMIWFKAKGISRVKIHTYKWNTKAMEIYEKNGFNAYLVSYEKFI